MSRHQVSIVKYESSHDAVRRAVALAGGLPRLHSGDRVVIKPNVVMWVKEVVFPKWGVLTTSRVIEAMVVLLKEQGVDDITIVEGMVTSRARDFETPRHAFKSLGYDELNKRYGVKAFNVMERPFEKVSIDDELSLNFNVDVMNCDHVINLPVMKTHAQTVMTRPCVPIVPVLPALSGRRFILPGRANPLITWKF